MNYTVAYRDGSQTKRVRISEAAALELQNARDTKQTVFLGKIQIKTSQILSIGPEDTREAGSAAKGTKEHKKRLREELRSSAQNCKTCPRETLNGKETGTGFIQGKDGMEPCTCQKVVKMLNGVDPFDYDYLAYDADV